MKPFYFLAIILLLLPCFVHAEPTSYFPINQNFSVEQHNQNITDAHNWNSTTAPNVNGSYNIGQHNRAIRNARRYDGYEYPRARNTRDIDAFGPIQTNLKRWR